MFFPGETITHRFVIPFNYNEVDKVILTYKQSGAIVFEKILTTGFEQVDPENPAACVVSFSFTQSEGLLFEDNNAFTVQVNVYTKAGTRHTSHETSSSTGVQYVREIIKGETFNIVAQPVNCEVANIGDTATFTVEATGVESYQWQYRVNSGTWKPCTNGTRKTLEVVATQERIDTHTYRCQIKYWSNDTEQTIATNVVKITHIDRSDE